MMSPTGREGDFPPRRREEAGTFEKMQLHTALGVALYSIGPSPGSMDVWKRVLKIAKRLRNTDYILRALWGMWTVQVTGYA